MALFPKFPSPFLLNQLQLKKGAAGHKCWAQWAGTRASKQERKVGPRDREILLSGGIRIRTMPPGDRLESERMLGDLLPSLLHDFLNLVINERFDVPSSCEY